MVLVRLFKICVGQWWNTARRSTDSAEQRSGCDSLTLTFQYDATLMNITEVKLGPDAPTGSQVQANLNTPGTVTLSFFALAPLTADQTDILQVIGTVPESATYGKAQVLDVTAVEVNAGALTARGNDAIHVVRMRAM